MEMECDLSKINNEELLRKMWQQSEDANRKKEIRSQLYKLRELRLRDLYQGDIMADKNSVAGFGKDPLVTSHGDALADQSFQSLKSKEVRDSLSPTEMKFQSMALNNPNTTGWNVQSSKEVSPDGKGFRAQTVATTDGVESLNGGIAEFKGRNEHLSSAHHQGDDKNFIKKAMESSNSHLQENVVLGDENSGRTEVRTSSTKSSSSSQVIQSSTNVEYDDGYPIKQQPHPQKYLIDSSLLNQKDIQQRQQMEQQRLLEEQRIYEQQFQQQHQQHLNQQERRTTEQVSTTHQNTQQRNVSQNIESQEMHEKNKRYVDMDKASPEYQQHVQQLMQQPGEIISNTVEYPKPNVKMITTVKRLPDGTIVRNKRYETEEMAPTSSPTRPTSTAPNQAQIRRDSQQPSRNYQPDSSPHSRPIHDLVDNNTTTRYVQDSHTDDTETKFSSTKKSSSKITTESTSETIQEIDDHHPHGGPSSRPKPKTNDFSTHGFPSVRSNKPTQEYPSERPHTAYPTQGYPSQPAKSRPTEVAVPNYTDNTDNITERRVNTKDGEVIIVSSQKQTNFKTSTNSERIVETENISHDDQPHQQIPNKTPQDFSTHGFPSVREPKNYPSEKQIQPHDQDFPLNKLPHGTRIINDRHLPHDEDVVVVSSQKSQTAKHSTNTERIIEHEITRDGSQGTYPRIQPNKDNVTGYNYTVTTPGEQTPQREFPGSPKKPNSTDYSTHGFPSARSPDDREPYNDYPAETLKSPNKDYTTKNYPSVTPTRPAAGLPSSHNQHPSSPRKSPSQDYYTQASPSAKSPTKGTPMHGYPSNAQGEITNGTAEPPRGTPISKIQPRNPSPNKYKTPNTTPRETTERVIRKEKEVDSAHRAFAASLRSSSPMDHVRRDSYTTDSHSRHTPRSSVSSSKTFRRDMREGSHDSAPSETSRFSTTTITRNTPPRSVGNRTVVSKFTTNKTGPGSNDKLNVASPRVTKSPSPGKTVTTTTTTTTRTLPSKDVSKVTDNQPTRITSNKIDSIFPINETPLTSITKLKFSNNHKQPQKLAKNIIRKKKMPVVTDSHASASAAVEEVIEAPCLKKQYYKLGPSDQTQAQLNPLKNSQIYEKSPTKKQSSQPQPAPSSRSSTPSSYNRKPQTSVMADDYDDDNLRASSPFSPPSSRSRTPQKIASNVNDKPRDDWPISRQPDNDERRTVNTETTFEEPQTATEQPRKPNFDQPNVEWIIVDNDDNDDEHDNSDDDYNDSFAPEVVDAELHVKKATKKLITQERQTTPQRKPRPTTTTTTVTTTKQFHTTPSKSQIKPNDKTPLKSKPNDSRTTQLNRTNKPLTNDSRSPVHTPSKSQTRVTDIKALTKSPKSTTPSYTSPIRKPLPRSTAEESTFKKSLKTLQVLKEKTTKLIEAEKPKRKPQSPERKVKPQVPDKRKPNGLQEQQTIVVTETTHRRLPKQEAPYDSDEEPVEIISNYKQPPEDIDDDTIQYTVYHETPEYNYFDQLPTPSPAYKEPEQPKSNSPGYMKPRDKDSKPSHPKTVVGKPQEIDDTKPRLKSSGVRKPLSPAFQKLQTTFGEKVPQHEKPLITDDDDDINQSPEDTDDIIMTDRRSKQNLVEEHISIAETSQIRYPGREAPKRPDQQPNITKPTDDKYIPSSATPGYGRPEPFEGSLDYKIPQDRNFEPTSRKIYEEDIIITETSKRAPKPQSPQNKPDENNQEKPTVPYSNKPVETYEDLSALKPEFAPSETDDDDNEYKTESECFTATSQRTVAKNIKKFETGFLKTKSPKPSRELSPIRHHNKPDQKTPKQPVGTGSTSPQRIVSPTRNQKNQQEPTGKRPQSPNKHTSPNRVERIPAQKTPTEPSYKRPQSPNKHTSPNRDERIPAQKTPTEPSHKRPQSPNKHTSTNRDERIPVQKTPTEPSHKRPQSPNKHTSPNRDERIPAQKTPTEPSHKRPQSPNKHVSPNRGQPKPEPIQPTDTRSKSPNKHVSPQRTQKLTDGKVDENFTTSLKTTQLVKTKIVKEIDGEEYLKPRTDDDEIFTETLKTQQRTVSKKLITDCEEPQSEKVTKLPARAESPSKSDKFPEKRSQSPTKTVSPTRAENRTDQTFRKSLRSTEVFKETANRKVGDKTYPTEEISSPKGHKPQPQQLSDTDEQETLTETSEYVINSLQKQVVTGQNIGEFDKPQRDSKYPIKDVSPTRHHRKPDDKFQEYTEMRPQSPKKSVSPTRSTHKKPDNETFTSTFTTKKILNENVTRDEHDEEYQQIKKSVKSDNDSKSPTREPTSKRPQSPHKTLSPTRNKLQNIRDDETFKTSLTINKTVSEKLKNPKENKQYPHERTPGKPLSEDEEDVKFAHTSQKVVNLKTCKITEEPIQEPEKPMDNIPKEREAIRPDNKRSPSPVRPNKKPTHEDDIYESTMKTSITKTEKTTRNEDRTPHKKGDQLDTKPRDSKTYPDNPSDNEEDEYIRDSLTTSKTRQVTEKLVHEFEEPNWPIKVEDSVGRKQPTQTKPDHILPQDNESFIEINTSNKFITKKTTHDTISNEEKPKEQKPKMGRPTETDGDEKTFMKTTDFIFKSTNKSQHPDSEKPSKMPQHPISGHDNETLSHNTEVIHNISQKLIATEQETLETEKNLYYVDKTKDSRFPSERQQSPTRSPSPKTKKPKSNDDSFKQSLRTADKTKPKDKKPIPNQPTDTDEEETSMEVEDLLIETCEKSYKVVEKERKKPGEKKPENPNTQDETFETIEGQAYPKDAELFPATNKYPKNKQPSEISQELWLPTKHVTKYAVDVNDQFIENERVRKETPDGAFISKTTEPTGPTSPTFKKKGTGRNDTFEERCRQILGMETYGDTPGSFKNQPSTIVDEQETAPETHLNSTVVFQVKIEDCDEEDESFSINSVKKTLHKQEPFKNNTDKLNKTPAEPITRGPKETFEHESVHTTDDRNDFVPTTTETTTVHKKSTKNKSLTDERDSDFSETETVREKYVVESKKSDVKQKKYVEESKKSDIKKTSSTTSSRSNSPTKSISSSRSASPTKATSSTVKDSPKRKPHNKDLPETKTNKKTPQKPDNDNSNIKERLRSSTRKTKSNSKTDQIDGSESSPEHSPTRYSERRRSSNISVTTEIIIEHNDSDTPNKREKSPSTIKKSTDSVYKEIIDSTVMPEKLTRRMLVTERKESAPVHRVTSKDKDSKISRSTSENLIKVKNSETHSTTVKSPSKPTDHRRPNKCFATKSINLSATDRMINTGEMENVIIDIQHAKSSREPSPDKIVPTPVPAHFDTGKPRYPDVVQEPEDDQPRRNPQVKNIPIFEEEHNSYVGCHITEINVERINKTHHDSLDYEQQILKNPVVEAPSSLDYISLDKPYDDESPLTVHEKVHKFQNIAEEIHKPRSTNKVTKDHLEQDTKEFEQNDHVYSTVKLAATAPQKSPELVRTISKHISKQNEIDGNNETNEDHHITGRNDDHVECLVNKKKSTKEFKVSHHETTAKTAEKYQQPKNHDDHDDDDDDELIPHTATHTTRIEERRQKDILNRPSVFEGRNKKPTAATTTATKTTTEKNTLLKCNKSPVKDSEKLRPDNKSRTKPTSAVTNTPTEQTITTTTRTISATSNKPNESPKPKNSDIDYELHGSNVNAETGVRNIISKQTKVYTSNNTNTNTSSSSISDSKTNDLKKQTTSNKRPAEKHMPVRLTPAKNSDEHDLSADDEIMIVTDIDTDFVESQVVNEEITNRKIPLTDNDDDTQHKKQPTTAPHSSTNSSPTDQQLLKTKTKDHLVKLTDKHPFKSNTVTTTTTTTSTSSNKTYDTIETADDIDETVLEPQPTKKSPSHHPHNKTNKMTTSTTDSVAARRSLFESNNGGPGPIKRTPLASPMSSRRPSYMEHTKSSLEHTRRDSLEINKTNYSRKPSQPEEDVPNADRNSQVKFDVPQGKRATTPRAISVTEDINVEEIFDLDVLEKLMETVQSYEIRRRIRAQIRLIKKNQKNELISSTTTEVNSKTTKTTKLDGEEPDTSKPRPADSTSTHTTTQTKEASSHISSSKKEYIFDEPYHPTTRRSPKPNRYPYEEEKEQLRKPTRNQSPQSPVGKRNAPLERQHSPEHQKHTELVREQEYYYKDDHEHEEEEEEFHEIRHETSSTRKSLSPSRKPQSISSSPERSYGKPESRSPTRNNERSRSPQAKTAPSSRRVTTSRSPDGKTSPSTSIRKSSASYEQQETVNSSISKPQTKRITTTTTTTTTSTKSKPDDKIPVWADRKNILKAPSSTTPKKPSSSSSSTTLDSRTGYTKTSKSTTSQKMTSNKSSSSFIDDDDCITSSYGIGPTDENGLPLFGIRALKKKKSTTVEPSETTEEVTGYVVEEKYYSDNKSKPKVERKEFIYSTNPEELQKLKQQVEVTTNRKALKDVELKESRKAALITKAPAALRSSPEDDFIDSSTKYVRRGSVKEMSEKFIQKEASSSVTEKSNYPKAGLILRTNSRKNSRDVDNESEHVECYKTIRVQQHHSNTALADSDDNQQDEYEIEEVASRQSGRFITESESECDSIQTQREFKKVTSSSSSSMATRSFLNSQGEEKVVTNVSECLERMRNADNVVEEGDTTEDQEARALLNKFLGANIIMKGVESSLPAMNRQSKIITTTTTSCNLSDDNDGDNNAKQELKTTRITKTINSGSSSTPVTYTTCDIEEIWDEDILKELLEQARTYEERRKIRSRLRELMADREATKQSPKGDKKEAAIVAVAANVPEDDEESSASEYEEIIEEVTDYSEAESDFDNNKQNDKVVVVSKQSQNNDKLSEIVAHNTEETSVTVVCAKPDKSSEQIEEEDTKTVIKTEIVEEVVDETDSSDKGESSKPIVHDKLQQKTLQTMPQDINAHSNQSANSQKLKSPQTSSNKNKSKSAISESSSMHASYNNSNYKTPKATSAAPVVTERTNAKTDSTSISNKNNHNNSSTSSRQALSNTTVPSKIVSNSGSGSGSLGGNSVVVGNNDSPRQLDRLGVPHKEDSGTESGEDLRLIAAGLRDQLQIQSDSNIIEEVTCALSRLESSLKEGKDISVDTEKRKALLALVARLRAGLTSPEKLAEIAAAMSELDGNDDGLYGETSSPEADAHRSNRSRFGKRKTRGSRHTVGVSREELADARRYMEDMLLMSNISQSTTPEANIMSNSTPPQWFPLEKNASTGSILAQPSAPVLQRPKKFLAEESANTTHSSRLTVNGNKRRPLSGEYSVSFEKSEPEEIKDSDPQGSDGSKASRFTNKKHLMKRANTIDLAKTHKYNPELDTDSDAEDKSASLGLKRGVQVTVKQRVKNVVPPFEPKTENDRKFLAFINKQSDKPGLSWTNSRSVSNWSNKFGSIKSTFEGGLAAKPPLAPYHASANTKLQQNSKSFSQPATNNPAPLQTPNYMTNQEIALKLQREAERQAEERRRKLEKEHLEYERCERDKLERLRQQHERQERERLEREHFERQRRQQDQVTAAQHAAILRKQELLAAAQQTAANIKAPKAIPINEFKHAPQSVFRPIESSDSPSKSIYKPIPQMPRNSHNWQPFNTVPARSQANSQYGNTRPDNSFITSPPPSARSPIALPWASKPTVDSSSFKSKAHRFEERSKYDNISNAAPFIQRHNSLRSSTGTTGSHTSDDFRKRPSLPNVFDPYSVRLQMPPTHDPLAYLPPPQNISFTYSSLKPKNTHQSFPCLPSAVVNNSTANEYRRPRDSLTDPHSVPLVLTSTNPTYCPASQAVTPPQQQHISQPRLNRKFDLVSPANSTATSPSIYNMQHNDCTDDELDSDNTLLEYRAVSRVMRKPQSQTAVTVGRRTGHVSDDELYGKNSRAARNLLSTMKSLGNSNGITRPKDTTIKRPEAVTSPKLCLSPDGLSYQAPIVEPLFPEINKFESNRKPLYIEESNKQTIPTTYPQTTPRPQMGMYKSMESLNRATIKSQEQQPPPKPYVSETQAAYVVTYPIEDTTDDEDFSQLSQKKMMPPNSLDLRRHRNNSENSTGSSTTASMSFSQNLPSPNTNWTCNPIVVDESNGYQNKSRLYQNTNTNVKSSPAEPSYQAQSVNQKQNYNPPPLAAEYEEPSKRRKQPTASPKQTASVKPTYNGTATQPRDTTMPAAKPSHDNSAPKQLQQSQMSQKPIAQKLALSQKPFKQISEKNTTSTFTAKENKSLVSLRKTEDQHRPRGGDQSAINPKNSNIAQEMLTRLDQQRERISNEERRKSLGHTLDYQMEKQARLETQNPEIYKSSAPSDTPDIVKSSLPKDDTQPILKKFGPPQRHHYMPNSYQSPNANAAASSVTSTTLHSTKTQSFCQGNNLHSTSKQTMRKASQQILNNTRPTVMETPATPQPDDDYIPRNIVYNNIHAFSSMARRQSDDITSTHLEQHHTLRPSKLSKSDSWNQIMMLQSQHVPNSTTKFNQSPTNELRRTKSGHTLALPKMFEAAITKTDINEKQKTVAAYFSGQKSPTQQESVMEQMQQTTKRSVINRTKTSEKVSAASRKSLGSNVPMVPVSLQRSATMPHIANISLLDESNVEDAFEQLIMEQKQQKSSSSTTEKTETKEKDGAVVTTTTKVTTRTVRGSAQKPASPFAKFKELEGQNSQQSAKSPTTPKTTVGGSTASPLSGNQPIFKFTDPALNAKAATVKEQLLQWCQSKTQEYENIEITNFSTSWNNGLAFCALIHHFLPDAFDYSQLTPKNRRKNFELAFTVADEKAGIAPLLDVEDMVVMQRPDWKCVFVYVQSIYRRFRNCQ